MESSAGSGARPRAGSGTGERESGGSRKASLAGGRPRGEGIRVPRSSGDWSFGRSVEVVLRGQAGLACLKYVITCDQSLYLSCPSGGSTSSILGVR